MKKFVTYIMAVLLMINMICFQAVRAASEGLYAEAEIVDNNVMITGGGCLSTIRNAAVKICNPAGETVHLNQIDVNDDGTFAYMTALGENDGSGHYSITVMARGAKQPFVTDVYYLSGKEAEKIENGINAAASAKEAEALIRTEAEVLGIGGFTDQQVSVAAEMLTAMPAPFSNQMLISTGAARYMKNAAVTPNTTPYKFHCHNSVAKADATEAKPKTADTAVIIQRGSYFSSNLPANGAQIAETIG